MTSDRVDVTIRAGVAELLSAEACAEVLDAAVRAGGAPPDATISLTLSDDAELTTLNAEHMGADGPTDVLSFPLLPPGAFPAHEGQDPALRRVDEGFRLPPDAPVHLGDVIVSVERAIEQARAGAGGQTGDVAWEPDDELRLLITHGGLHICGWDHADPIEREAMRALERRLMAQGS